MFDESDGGPGKMFLEQHEFEFDAVVELVDASHEDQIISDQSGRISDDWLLSVRRLFLRLLVVLLVVHGVSQHVLI